MAFRGKNPKLQVLNSHQTRFNSVMLRDITVMRIVQSPKSTTKFDKTQFFLIRFEYLQNNQKLFEFSTKV